MVNELYDKWGSTRAWAGSAPWNDVWFPNLREWIKRNRNHPSVIMWSFGNELQFQEERWGFPTGDWGKTTYRIMDVVAKRYDPTRKTTVAMYPARASGIIKANPDFNTRWWAWITGARSNTGANRTAGPRKAGPIRSSTMRWSRSRKPGWVFRSIVPTDSGPSCPPIPVYRAHSFRSIVPSLTG